MRKKWAKRRCVKRGHELTPENRLRIGNWEVCRICWEIRQMRIKRGTLLVPHLKMARHEGMWLANPRSLSGGKSAPGGPFAYDFDMGDLPSWLDDPFALVTYNDTPSVLNEIQAGRTISARYVDRFPEPDEVKMIVGKLEFAIDKVSPARRERFYTWAYGTQEAKTLRAPDAPSSTARSRLEREAGMLERRAARLRKRLADMDAKDKAIEKRGYSRSSGKPPVPGANQIAHRIVQEVIEATEKQQPEPPTPEFKPCGIRSQHNPHVWAMAAIDGDDYWCPGVKAEPVLRRTDEGWIEAPRTSRYFQRRKTR